MLTDEQAGHGLPEHSEEALREELEQGDFRLKPHPTIPRCDAPLLLIVLDGERAGWVRGQGAAAGLRPEWQAGNRAAATPHLQAWA